MRCVRLCRCVNMYIHVNTCASAWLFCCIIREVLWNLSSIFKWIYSLPTLLLPRYHFILHTLHIYLIGFHWVLEWTVTNFHTNRLLIAFVPCTKEQFLNSTRLKCAITREKREKSPSNYKTLSIYQSYCHQPPSAMDTHQWNERVSTDWIQYKWIHASVRNDSKTLFSIQSSFIQLKD